MAEDNAENVWSEDAGTIIEALEPKINSTYGVSLKDLLNNPAFYVSKDGIETTVANIREEATSYISDLESKLQDDKKNLEKDGLKCDAVSKQLAQNISMQAKQNNVPLIKPNGMDRNEDEDEVLYINNIDNGTIALISKLTAISSFIVDFSTSYKTYSLGRWIFDGQKNYMVAVSMEPNPIIDLDAVNDELSGLIDDLEDYIGNATGGGNADAQT